MLNCFCQEKLINIQGWGLAVEILYISASVKLLQKGLYGKFYRIKVCDYEHVAFLMDCTSFRVTFYLPGVRQGAYFKPRQAKVAASFLAHK